MREKTPSWCLWCRIKASFWQGWEATFKDSAFYDGFEEVSAAQIIEETVLAAKADLAAFTLEPILAALKASPDGVDVSEFNGVEYKEVN